MTTLFILRKPNRLRFSSPQGSCEKIREGEAPAEPRGRKLLIQNGSAGASPSYTDVNGIFSQLQGGRGELIRLAGGEA